MEIPIPTPTPTTIRPTSSAEKLVAVAMITPPAMNRPDAAAIVLVRP